jgi:hypothetical protein
MRKLLLALALIASPAYAITPVTAPPGVRVDTVDEQVCVSVRNDLRNHIRNIYATRRAFNTLWYKNSKGEYLAFDCYYHEFITRPYTVQYYSVVYVTTKEVIDAQVAEEFNGMRQSLKEKQNIVKNSGYN